MLKPVQEGLKVAPHAKNLDFFNDRLNPHLSRTGKALAWRNMCLYRKDSLKKFEADIFKKWPNTLAIIFLLLIRHILNQNL